ncbi:YcxB family protein [Streptomyces sp. NBC_01336]|uniref:YcxB family protein n=1 Tax=Streptomyces sp. NBC_01336 TaxID=2903829 RepID=UPI002E10AEB0|nr:YcxB family protein [Streptomyces sp. NBC_01336]
MTVDTPVQLTYAVTWREISDGLRIQLRHSPVGRWCFRVLWTLGALLGFVIVANLLTRGLDAVGMGVWRFFLIACLLMVAFRWLTALALLGYARHLGEHRVTVDVSGIRTVTERHTNETGWKFYGRCVEGPRVFVLLTPDVWGAGVMVLPKRGLDAPQDADRLRELIGAHLVSVRLGKGPNWVPHRVSR